jgi:hypothetical protein
MVRLHDERILHDVDVDDCQIGVRRWPCGAEDVLLAGAVEKRDRRNGCERRLLVELPDQIGICARRT